MRTPKENAEGYKESSAFTRADKLHGNLLLVHGMADDNVHFQKTVQNMPNIWYSWASSLICKYIPIATMAYTAATPVSIYIHD